MNSLNGLSEKLVAWNRVTFGCIFERKKRIRWRLEGVLRALNVRQSWGLIKLEKQLKREWTEVLLQKGLLWTQKSQVERLKHGDRNTKFFHISMLVRRRRNKIEVLQDESRRWVEDGEKLKDMAVEYYSSLFRAEPMDRGESNT